MIRWKEKIYTDKRKSEIIGNIMLDLDPAPVWNLEYFTKFNKFLDSPKRFYGEIRHDRISLSSKGLIYWPASTIEIETVENQTVLRVKYRMFWLYASFYLLMAIPFFISVASQIIDDGFNSNGESSEVIWVFSTMFILLPLLGRWLQRNTIKFLVNF